jgi:hypothetical protein
MKGLKLKILRIINLEVKAKPRILKWEDVSANSITGIMVQKWCVYKIWQKRLLYKRM